MCSLLVRDLLQVPYCEAFYNLFSASNHMRKQKIAIVLLLMILIIWSSIRHWLSWPDQRSIAMESPLVVYCKVERNDKKEIFTIQDVWKDTRKSRSNLIGLKVYSKDYFATSTNQIPSDAVVFYGTRFLDKNLEISYVIYGTHGTIGGMASDQFRRACGL